MTQKYGGYSEGSYECAECIAEGLENSLPSLEPVVNKFLDSVREKIWNDITAWLVSDVSSGIHSRIDYEVERIIEGYLLGDIEAMKQTLIVSEYNFRRLPEVRKAIWDACAGEIEKSRLAQLEEDNKRLREHIESLRDTRY